MYDQYTTEHETELGTMRIERTYKAGELDSVIVSVAGRVIELPKHVARQTSRPIKPIESVDRERVAKS